MRDLLDLIANPQTKAPAPFAFLRLLEDTRSAVPFDNWVFPTDEHLAFEWQTEHDKMENYLGPVFLSQAHFVHAVKTHGVVIRLTPAQDHNLSRRTFSSSIEDIDRMVASYRSAARRKGMPQKIMDGFLTGAPMPMPLVIADQNNIWYVAGGNTRLDVAQLIGITPDPKVVLLRLKHV